MNAYYRDGGAARRRGRLRHRGRATSTSGTAGSIGDRGTTAARSGRSRANAWSRPPADSRPTSTGCKEAWGPAADNFLIRGTPYNMGHGAARAARPGREADRRPDAVPRGRDRRARAEVRRRHRARASTAFRSASSSTSTASASTTRARTSGRSATRSGAASSPQQPDQIAYSIIDAKAVGQFMPSVFPPVEGRLDRRARARARARSRGARGHRDSASTPPCGPARSTTRRSTTAATEGLAPPKTHWARPIDTPPFFGYPLRPGHHLHLPRRAR